MSLLLICREEKKAEPQKKRYLAMEIEKYRRLLCEGGPKKDMWWTESLKRIEAYRIAAGITSYDLYPCLDVSMQEKQALKKLFLSLKGDGWSKNQGWTGQAGNKTKVEIKVLEAQASTYEGVETSVLDGRKEKILEDTTVNVTSINLPGAGLQGPLPGDLGLLQHCRELDLSWNIINGSISKNLRSLHELTDLNLSHNGLEGSIPIKALSAWANLTALNLSHNKLSGNIPNTLELIPGLTELNLSFNFFTGPLPGSLCLATKLLSLKLNGNQLTGSLDAQFSKLKHLKLVNLSENRLEGGINALFECHRLERLILNNNCLKDRLTPTIGKLHKLEVLNLQNNELNGPFPVELCTLPKLRIMNISNNHLSGKLPEELGMLTQLETLVVTNNYLRGPVPYSVAQLTQLRDFSIFKSHPQVDMCIPRGFTKKRFNRVFLEGPKMGLDAICWDDQVVFGVTEQRRKPIMFDYCDDDLPTPPPEQGEAEEEARPPTPEKWKRAFMYS